MATVRPARLLAIGVCLAMSPADGLSQTVLGEAGGGKPPGPPAAAAPASDARARAPDLNVLPPAQWVEIDRRLALALAYLASQQRADGSFATEARGQPGVTSLAIMAFLSAGHFPQTGPHAETLRRAVDFVLDCQQPDGALALHRPTGRVARYNADHTIFYNHGISGLMLGEVYGMTTQEQDRRIRAAIPRALAFLQRHQRSRVEPVDDGGWRYAHPHTGIDADMSCTAWQIMFLRSAKNASFPVSDEVVDNAVAYVERCYDPAQGIFRYGLIGGEQYPSGGAVGGAILSLSLTGRHRTSTAMEAYEWLAKRRVEVYNSSMGPGGNYHYGLYYASQASLQLGGGRWEKMYPRIIGALLANQQPSGAWPPDRGIASPYGQVYSTSLAVLSITPPFQLLPIYQH